MANGNKSLTSGIKSNESEYLHLEQSQSHISTFGTAVIDHLRQPHELASIKANILKHRLVKSSGARKRASLLLDEKYIDDNRNENSC